MDEPLSRTEVVRRNLMTLLARHHIQQTQLSRALGLERSYINKILIGTRSATLDGLDAIAAFFHISPSQLIHENGVDDRRLGERRSGQDRRVHKVVFVPPTRRKRRKKGVV